MRRPLRTLTAAEELRVFAGLAAQPVVASAVAFFGFPLLDPTGNAGNARDAALSVAIGAGIVALFVTLLCAFPTVVWMIRRRRVSFALALLFGLGFGNFPMMLGAVLAGGIRNPMGSLAFGSLVGAAGAAVFWLISIRGRDFSRDPEAHTATVV